MSSWPLSWSAGRERYKAGGKGSISLPQGIWVPTSGSRNDMPPDDREECDRSSGTVRLKGLRLLPLAKSSAIGGVDLQGHC